MAELQWRRTADFTITAKRLEGKSRNDNFVGNIFLKCLVWTFLARLMRRRTHGMVIKAQEAAE